ncbi:MAG: methyltransferase domain-containing protein [Deltaproteobacteria bacterium]|nr:MAG: methyltransferase domain-containing protein [Deltaproteobacteria bacterium]
MSDVLDRLPAIVEPTRARLLRTLSREELGVGEIAMVVQLPQSTVSRHLKVLHTDGWLDNRREGTASLFRMAEVLPPGAAALWEVVREATEARWALEDDLRLRAVLDARVVDAEAFFGQVAGRWEEVRSGLFGTTYVLPTLLALLPEAWTVLDLGTGTGSMAAELAHAVRRVIAVDREQAMLDAARARLEGLDNVDLIRASLHDLPLPDASVDAALCSLVLHHQARLDPILAEARRVLKPGGRVVILDMVEHDRAEYRASMGHHHLGFSEQTLRQALARSGFCEARWRALPAEPGAKGPPLFIATAG